MSNAVFDASYFSRLIERDAETERHFVSHFTVAIRAKLRRQLRSPELIEDIRQETFLRVFKYLHSGKVLDLPERLAAFVHSTCQNVMFEFLRGDARHPPVPDGAPDVPDLRLDIERDLVTEERKRAVRDILATLPDKDREILRLLFLEEWEREDVCRRFGVEAEYLRVLLHRAKLRFKAAMERGKTKAAEIVRFFCW